MILYSPFQFNSELSIGWKEDTFSPVKYLFQLHKYEETKSVSSTIFTIQKK